MARPGVNAGRNLTRRGLLVLALQFGLVGALGWRMRQLQVEDAERYRLLAEENRINIRLIPPARGLIFDRKGEPIAVNQQNYRIVMIREQAGDEAAVLDRLSTLIPISPERKERVLRDMRGRSAFVPVTVVEHLAWEEFARVASNAPALPGVVPEVGLSRFYPHGPEFAHLIGYVGPVSDWDLSQIDEVDPLLQIPDFQIGKTGVEKRLEGNLRGEAGTSRIEVNAAGRVIRELDRADGRAGTDLQLSIDQGLQSYALERMNRESAATVVMDVRSGEILAMASSPSFDPNSFVFGISTTDWRALNEDEYRPMYNKTVSGVYPPGSTFKMVVALAALEAGVVGPEETFYCNGGLQLGDRRFHCWRRWGHGHVDLHDSLKHSCDVYYYEVSQRVGIERITEMARKLGLGESPQISLPAVAGGLTPTKGWKQAVHGQSWLVGDTLNASIGQGYVLASPLQLATMTARIATGKAVNPQLTREVAGTPFAAPDAPDLDISEASLRRVRSAMFAVSNHRRGTAWAARIADEAMAMSGKTGTSQVRRITEAERRAGVFRNEDLPWNRRDHALFVAFAPHDDPKYAISVVVEHGGGGSKAAAPIARDVMIRALYGANAPLEAWPEALREEIEQRRSTPPAAAEAGNGSDRA
ncbi:MAG: penicillin-binding protein 2 [Pseudomonadota bacterium]